MGNCTATKEVANLVSTDTVQKRTPGSYFARDAKYSHSYTADSASGRRCMFVCRILAGHYTTGDPSYLRPPSKDGGDTVFYDSCVNDFHNPSIFVIFEKHQVYPEYLIQYGEGYTTATATATATAPAYAQPRITTRPTPTQRATPVFTSNPAPAAYSYSYASSSASARPSSSAQPPTAAAYASSSPSSSSRNSTYFVPSSPSARSTSPRSKPQDNKCVIS